MHQVKQLYVLVTDEDCHDYLVPKEEYVKFSKRLKKAEDALEDYVFSTPLEYQDDDDELYDLKEAVSDCYEGLDKLEGERYYVVKLNDVVES